MDGIDARDFNKSRSFLIGWSILIFCLWFFGADLTKFKLMGNEITLTRNSEKVWLVIGMAALYLWCRCYQHLPEHALKFNEDMNELYDRFLCLWPWLRFRVCDFKKINDFRRERKLSPVVKVTKIQFEMNRLKLQQEDGPVEPWDQSSEDRTKMQVSYYCHAVDTSGEIGQFWGFGSEVKVPLFARVTLKLAAFFTGMFTKSWFTDYVAPLIIGLGAAFLAFYQWCVVAGLEVK